MITLARRDETRPVEEIGIEEPPGSAGHDASLTLVLVGGGRATPGLVSGLASHPEVRIRAPSPATALDDDGGGVAALENLLLVGPQVPDPLDLIRRASGSYRHVLYLAPRSDSALARGALEAGADDVLPPPHSCRAILFRARIVVGRNHPRASNGRIRIGPLEVDPEGRRLLNGSGAVQLTGREFELLDRLLQARGAVVSRARLLEDIWGEEQESEGVLDATIHRLRRKLEREVSEPRYLTTVRGVGYRLDPGP